MFLWNIAVTSLAEVWIEISMNRDELLQWASLPLRKCGLKFSEIQWNYEEVKSLAEVWIEINYIH